MALILIVDDDRTMRTLLSLAMEEEGYDVIEASNGRQAIAEFNRCQPDLVLMDAVMPLMDGFSCCQHLTQNRSVSQQAPVLMLTVLDDHNSVKAAFDAGATDFITKPIQWPVLSQRVQRLLDASETQKETLRLSQLMGRFEQRTEHLTQLMYKILNHQDPEDLLSEALEGLREHCLADRLYLRSWGYRYWEARKSTLESCQKLGILPLQWSPEMLKLQRTDHPGFWVQYDPKDLDARISADYQKLDVATTAIFHANPDQTLDLWIQSHDLDRIWTKRDQRHLESFFPCLSLLCQIMASNQNPDS